MYHVFLRNILPELLEDVPLHIRNDIWFQLDGALQLILVSFRLPMIKSIGRGEPIHWPARSPVHTIRVGKDLIGRIVEAVAKIKEYVDIFERVRRSGGFRVKRMVWRKWRQMSADFQYSQHRIGMYGRYATWREGWVKS